MQERYVCETHARVAEDSNYVATAGRWLMGEELPVWQ